DLDWIVMKALEKDRARRYETANGLALDIKRHLDCEPVLARPASTLYRFRRLVLRNKLGLSAGTAVMAALVIGLIAAISQADRARHAEAEQSRLHQQAVASLKKSETEGAKAEASRKQAEAEAVKATANELQMRRYLYAADMNRAQDALRLNNLGRARRLLDGHRPKPGELDLRGWEWRYLWQQCRSGAIATLTRHSARAISVSFSGDSRFLAVAFEDGQLEVWDVVDRKKISALKGNAPVRFGPRGYTLAFRWS
ncbi:MAG: hypothetical protein ABI680_08815, partial [Chthoniobacteraceae bacterium]